MLPPAVVTASGMMLVIVSTELEVDAVGGVPWLDFVSIVVAAAMAIPPDEDVELTGCCCCCLGEKGVLWFAGEDEETLLPPAAAEVDDADEVEGFKGSFGSPAGSSP